MPCSEDAAAGSVSKRARAEDGSSLRFVRLSEHATAPTRGSAGAAGYDLYSAYDYTIAPMEKAVVKTDIQIAVPSGCYGRVAPRSGLAVKYFIDVGAVTSSHIVSRDWPRKDCCKWTETKTVVMNEQDNVGKRAVTNGQTRESRGVLVFRPVQMQQSQCSDTRPAAAIVMLG
ncbi:Deoxyuridine 5'-triphosphate nucleotidohydrolase [Microtus ochrogaster]|uniref:Deoxyuridine 5'-triphosphate nucleotidohydrolase n=1 Tax=Microtus ochrogaster TaxID=79684 RepID=A0A8J6G431_MICOH|nr:Deoxyuridine 5'-triphosphate nucleotidohydrolase [Microtus ochrogaster]